MKIIITADWHLSDHKNIFPSPEVRKRRCVEAYSRFMSEVAKDYDMHIVAGDFFDGPKPSYYLTNCCGDINDTYNIEKIFLVGNHDHTEEPVDNPLFSLGDGRLVYDDVYFEHNRESDWDIIFISHQRDPVKWLEILKYHVEKIHNKRRRIYVVCHQWFDCFCGFDSKEVIKFNNLQHVLAEYLDSTDFYIISGHLHEQKMNNNPLRLYSIGIPLHQDFGDAEKGCTAIAIDTNFDGISQIGINICDSEFVTRRPSHGLLNHDKKHFYRADIKNSDDEECYKEMIELGYKHTIPNYNYEKENLPDRLQREEVKKEYTREDIVSETVDEIGNGDEGLKQKGIDILRDAEVPF